MKGKLLASAASLERITALINQYYCSSNQVYAVNMEDGTVYDTNNGAIRANVLIRKANGRYRFEMKG